MSKQEADRVADALGRNGYDLAMQQAIYKAAALLRQWPDGEPVAWVDDLARAQPHCVTDLKYCSVAQHDRGDHLKYVPLYTAPPAKPDGERVIRDGTLLQAERIAALENDIHSCHPGCTRAGCVAEKLREAIEEQRSIIETLKVGMPDDGTTPRTMALRGSEAP